MNALRPTFFLVAAATAVDRLELACRPRQFTAAPVSSRRAGTVLCFASTLSTARQCVCEK